MQRVPVQRAEAVQGGDSLRASAHRPGVPAGERGRARRCRRTSRRQRHRRRIALRPRRAGMRQRVSRRAPGACSTPAAQLGRAPV
ncbi:hypothetical protein G6F31_013236 [Rhizopus arrhizus]|nr:hypothetical protein G6F31_013236 [Rhizopus arrhizus]